MDDGFSAEKMKRASEFFFFKDLISPKNGANEEAPFLKKNWFPAKIRAKKWFFLKEIQRKKRKTDVIFRLKKMVSPNKNGAAKY